MSDQPTNPYVGPRTFEEKDSEYFFGRDREGDELISMIISEPLVLFYAQSGAGKSSLLNARVIPGLREEGFTVLPVGRVGGALPEGIGEVKNAFTTNLLLSLDQGRREASDLAKLSLVDYFKGVRSKLEKESGAEEELALLLVIDQFEEIITSNLPRWKERDGFFSQLQKLMKADPLLWIVLSLREDYVAALDPFKVRMPDRMRVRYHMQRMGAQAARAAIEKPAANNGRPFAPGVAAALVDNLRQLRLHGQQTVHVGEFVEPVQLQVVCYQLWQNLKERPLAEITQKDLDELGDVDASLSQFYEQAICDVLERTGGSEIALRNWFDRELITEAETRGTVYQGASETAGMPNEIVNELENHFLLRAEIRAGATWYELVHDRFVSPILQANQSWRVQQSPLIQAAEAWVRADRSRELLYEGKQLKDALAAVNRDTAEEIVLDFLTASEEAQSQQELEAARKVAEEERKRADAQTRTSRILRSLAGALLVVFLIAVAAATRAVQQGKVADQNADDARMQAALADSARATAEASAIEADEARARAVANELDAEFARQTAEVNAQEALDARAEAEENAQAAIANAEEAQAAQTLAEENEKQAEEAQQAAEASAAEAERLRQVALAQSLAALAPRIIDQSYDTELAVLLALESLRINKEYEGGLQGLIDGSLRGILSQPNFNTTLDQHETRVVSLAFSPDRQRLASADEDGTIRLWDLSQQATPSSILATVTGDLHSLAFSPDGQWLAYVHDGSEVHIWDLETPPQPGDGQSPTVLDQHSSDVRYFAFGPGELQMTTTTADNEVLFWNLSASPPIVAGQFQRTGGNLIVGISPDAETLVTADNINTINTWDLTVGGAPRKNFLIGHTDPVNVVAFTLDSSTMASADEGGQIRIWDLTDPNPFPTRLFTLKSPIAKMVLSADGRTLVSYSQDVAELAVQLWDLDNPADPPVLLEGHGSTIEDVSLSGDGLLLASASSDRTIRLWDLTAPSGLPTVIDEFAQGILSVAFDDSGDYLATGGEDQLVHVISLVDGLDGVALPGHKGQITSLAFSPSAPMLASASDDGTVRLWDVQAIAAGETIEPIAVIGGHEQAVRSVAFSPDGQLLASASEDATIRLWDLAQVLAAEERPMAVSVLESANDAVWAVAFSPDGGTLASGHASSAILIWDVSEALSAGTASPARRLLGHTGGVFTLVFSPDGELLASAGHDLNILLWSPGDYDEDPLSLGGHDDWVFSLSFSPDGRELASASWDQTIRLWDISDVYAIDRSDDDYVPNEPTTLTGHSSVVRSVAYSPDGSTLASASEDKTVRLWKVEANSFVDLACQQVRRNLTWPEWERHIGDEEYQLTCANLPVHPSFVESARALAEDGDVEGALGRFAEALSLDPTLDIDGEAETAAALLEGGLDQAGDGQIEEALAFFSRAQDLRDEIEITVGQWFALCKAGADSGNALLVIDACQNAVTLAASSDDISINGSLCALGTIEDLTDSVAPSCRQASDLAAATEDAFLNYQLCARSSDADLATYVSTACERANELIGDISFGQTVSGTVLAEGASLWAFEGTEGQVVTISMVATSGSDLDTFVTLLGPHGSELIFNDDVDDSSDSLIEAFTLTESGTYVIVAQGFRNSAGAYRLTLQEER